MSQQLVLRVKRLSPNAVLPFRATVGAAGYDLAVVDYMMPGLNGLELAKELRRLHPDKPVAITSGLISEELRRDAPQAGITELINKANTGTDLLKAISRLARRVAPDQ